METFLSCARLRIFIRTFVTLFLIFQALACKHEPGIPAAPPNIDLSSSFYCEIDAGNPSAGTFKVRFYVNGLTLDNATIQFPAVVPGTFQILDLGQFIKNFRAFDEDHKEVTVTQTSTNQWALSDPENTRILEYEASETFVNPSTVFPPSGTSIDTHAELLNMAALLGYPVGLRERDYYVAIKRAPDWSVGTSLPRNDDGLFYAPDYDFLLDNPVLLGALTNSSFTIVNTDITVTTYSEGNKVSHSKVTEIVKEALADAQKFLKVLPVDHYSFLFYFNNENASGAHEYSNSSVYVMPNESAFPTYYSETLKNLAAHEFFHTVTPLSIRSEVIADFNFAIPTPSQHIWLYEGVTKWAEIFMQYRSGSIDIDALFVVLGSRISVVRIIDPNYTLTQASLDCFKSDPRQHSPLYTKGSLVAMLLDIRLLELSGGTMGLRELILDLSTDYNPHQPFPEATFFDVLVSKTYPEIEDFINRYINGTELLPLVEYFDKLGITYAAADNSLTIQPSPTTAQRNLFNKWSVNF